MSRIFLFYIKALAQVLLILVLPFSICADELKVRTFAKSAILMNADSGAILYQKNADDLAFPASLTKVGTAGYLLSEERSMDEVIVAPRECLRIISPKTKRNNNYAKPYYILETDGTHFSLRQGEQLTFESLFYGLMVASGNDAANVLAHHISGSIDQFMEELNEYLKKIGCKSTHFTNPHGLHIPTHRTTARDLAIMARCSLKNPFFRKATSTVKYERPTTNKQSSMILTPRSKLLKEGVFYYPKVTGMKTGYTSAAGYNLFAVAKKNDRELIAILLGGKNSNERYQDAIRLFDAAFSEVKISRQLFCKGDMKFQKEVVGGVKTLVAHVSRDVSIEYFPSEEPQIFTKLVWNKLHAPIAKNDIVGKVCVFDETHKLLREVEIEAASDVQAKVMKRIKNFWKRKLRSGHSVLAALVCALWFGRAYFKKKRSEMDKLSK